MEVVQADGDGRVNVNSGDEIKMTGNTAMPGTLEKIGNTGFPSRERKKSKYLSYPYTNIGSRNKGFLAETEDLKKTPRVSHKAMASSKATNPLNRSHSFAKLGSNRFRTNWYRKFISRSTMSSSPEFINASPAQLLSGLYSKAVDCMSPTENISFDLVEYFFCKYRVSKYHDEAELASSLINGEGGNTVEPVGNNLLDIKTEKKKRTNDRAENAVRRKMKSLSGLSDVNISTSTGDSLRHGRKLKQKRKVDEVTSLHQLQNVDATSNESSSKHSSVNDAPQNLRSETDAKSNKCSSLVIDLQPISPPIPRDIAEKSIGANKETGVENRMEEEDEHLNIELATEIPDLNGTSFVSNSIRKECENVIVLSPEVKSVQPRSLSACERHTKTVKDTGSAQVVLIRSADAGEAFGSIDQNKPFGATLVNDKLHHPSAATPPAGRFETPSQTTGFMPLHHSSAATTPAERFGNPTQPTGFMPVHHRYVATPPAERLGTPTQPSGFMPLHHSSAATPPAERFGNPTQPTGLLLLHHPSAATPPADQFWTPTHPTGFMLLPGQAPPPLHIIKQNLEKMKSILESSGNNLSPQTRAKLDMEIKNLMNKVNSRTSSLPKSQQ